MKFLIDENVGNSVVRYLKDNGHDIIVASKEGFSGREDDFLLEHAFKEERIIITNDKDFGFLVFRQKMPSKGVILFRFIQELPSLKVKALEAILSLKPERILNHFTCYNQSDTSQQSLCRCCLEQIDNLLSYAKPK